MASVSAHACLTTLSAHSFCQPRWAPEPQVEDKSGLQELLLRPRRPAWLLDWKRDRDAPSDPAVFSRHLLPGPLIPSRGSKTTHPCSNVLQVFARLELCLRTPGRLSLMLSHALEISCPILVLCAFMIPVNINSIYKFANLNHENIGLPLKYQKRAIRKLISGFHLILNTQSGNFNS